MSDHPSGLVRPLIKLIISTKNFTIDLTSSNTLELCDGVKLFVVYQERWINGKDRFIVDYQSM
jgi:hypothetical protein